MVDAIVSFAVQRLGDFLIQEAAFLQEVVSQVVWLKDELGYMQSFLRDAEEKQGGDHRVRQWVYDIRILADDAVDIIDSFPIKARKQRPSSILDCMKSPACICNKEIKLYNIGKEIASLKKRITDLTRANKYLNELINRSLIQVAATFWEQIVKCRAHDLIRDLSLHEATEVNLFNIFDPRKHLSPLMSRRHIIHNQTYKYFSLGLTNSKLRSSIFFNPDYERGRVEDVIFICRYYKLQRVLDFKGFSFSKLPGMIGELIHLKFLRFKNFELGDLSPSIGNLKSLQTLVITGPRNCKLPWQI